MSWIPWDGADPGGGGGGGGTVDQGTGGASPWLITGTVTADAGAGTFDVSAASLPLPTGAATEATLATRLGESDFDTKIGSLTETAPSTDTASSGVNGRLQRIAQRLTSLITAIGSPFQAGGSIGNTSFGATVADGANVVEGATTDAAVSAGAGGSISAKLRAISRDIVQNVVLAAGTNNIGDVDVLTLPKSGTGTLSNVSGSASSVTLAASNASRLGLTVYNDSSVQVYVKCGSSASSTSFSYYVGPGGTLEMPFGYTGIVTGVWPSATGTARVTEFT